MSDDTPPSELIPTDTEQTGNNDNKVAPQYHVAKGTNELGPGITIIRIYKPDLNAQVAALEALLKSSCRFESAKADPDSDSVAVERADGDVE